MWWIATPARSSPRATSRCRIPEGKDAGERYSPWVEVAVGLERQLALRLAEDERTVNMSAFRHFERYTGGKGGKTGPHNEVDITGYEAVVVSDQPAAPPAARATERQVEAERRTLQRRRRPMMRIAPVAGAWARWRRTGR
jgi:hypothetical protein